MLGQVRTKSHRYQLSLKLVLVLLICHCSIAGNLNRRHLRSFIDASGVVAIPSKLFVHYQPPQAKKVTYELPVIEQIVHTPHTRTNIILFSNVRQYESIDHHQ
jgi:hypothetical protein